jgi:glycerol-3-phosphate acyltransferase PlsY
VSLWLESGIVLIGAYLLGSVPAAYLMAKWFRGIDIRNVGTGNVGSANVLQSTSSKWLALIVFLFDGIKGAFAVWVAQLLNFGTGMQMTIGLVAIIGHNWPVFLGFRGGRGIITSLGVITIMSPWLGLIVFVIAYALMPFKQLALGVCIGLLALPLFSWFLSQPLGIEERLPVTIGFVILTCIAFVRRLAVPRSEISSNMRLPELLLNRLLFDRDIRNRREWIERQKTDKAS